MGKGSGRRVENAKAVSANWARAFGKKVDEHGPTWTDTTTNITKPIKTVEGVLCPCGHFDTEHMPDCSLCRGDNYGCDCEKDRGGVLLAALREAKHEAKIARHIKAVLPLVYEQMVREVASGLWPGT